MCVREVGPDGGGLLREPGAARQERRREEPRVREPQRVRARTPQGCHPRTPQEHQDWRGVR